MPELSAFLISESVQNVPTPEKNFAPQLSNPIVVIRPQFLPSNFSFGLTFGVMGVDPALKNQLQLKLLSPSNVVVYDTHVIDLPVDPRNENILPPEYRGFMMNMDLRNVAFAESGCYVMEIYINSNLIARKNVPVYKRNDPVE